MGTYKYRRKDTHGNVMHPETDASCVLFEDGTTLTNKNFGNEKFAISDYRNELMAHDFRFIGMYKGCIYGIYNGDNEHTVENAIHTNIHTNISEISLCNLQNPEFYHIVVAGESIFGTSRACYDPTGYIVGNKMYCITNGIVGGEITYCYDIFNLDERKASGVFAPLKLDGNVMNLTNVRNSYNAKSAVSCGTLSDIGLNVKIIKDGGMYWSVINATGDKYYGLIIKSTDLINWTSVATPNLSTLTSKTWEGTVAVIESGKTFAFAIRNAVQQGIFYGTFNVETNTFSSFVKVPNSITTRPEFFHWKGDLYLAVNIEGSVTTQNYGTVVRATMRIFKVSNGVLSPVLTKSVKEGIHYFTFINYNDEKLYIAYSTDVRRLDYTQARSNTAMEEISI